MRNIFILPIILAMHLCSYAGTIHVQPGSKISTLHEALNQANPFDEIILHAGIYKEGNIIISKPVSIIGENNPVIDGEGMSEILSVKSNNVNISGITIQNTGYTSMEDRAAIKLYNVRNCVITNNIVLNSCFGIYLMNTRHCVVKNNSLNSIGVDPQKSGNGIHVWKSDSLTIKNNSITGHRDGLYFEFVTFTGVYENKSLNNLRYGIHFMFSNDDEYIGNTFSHNGSGVAVMFSKHVTMLKNIFEFSEGGASFGILLKEITDSHIEENKFLNNTVALFMEGCNRMLITRNLLQSNGWALKIQANCSDITVAKNNFFGNSFDIATNGSLQMNFFNNNYWDKYEGYDLNKNNIGDVPYNPVSLYSIIVDRMPYAMILYRSFMVHLLDRSEKIFPGINSENLKDNSPLMKPADL